MKKRIFLFSLLLTLFTMVFPTTASAQQQGIITWQKNGNFDAFLYCDVDSITYSKVDLNGRVHSNVVVQEIWTPDSVYRTPISDIDSIAFRAPETIYKDGVFHITEWHYDYVTDATDLTVTFDASIPADSLPSVGQVVVSDMAFVQYFEKGFAGRVIQIKNLGSSVRIICEEISFEDIYDQLFSFGKSVGYNESDSPSRAPRRLKIDEEGVSTFDLSKVWPIEPFKIIDDESGHVYLNVDPSISLNYALCYNVRGKENRFKCVLSPTLDCSFDVNWNKSGTKHFEPQNPFVKVNIPTKIPLLFAQFNVNGFLDLTGSVDLSAQLPFKVQSNIGYDSQEGFVHDFKGSGIQMPQGSVDLSASVHSGLSLGFESFFINERLDWAEAGVQLKVGPQFTGTIRFESDAVDGLDLYDNFKNSKVTVEPLVAQISANVNTIFLDEPKTWDSGQWSVFGGKDYYLFPEFTAPHWVSSTSTALTTDISRDLIFKVTPGIGLYQNNQLKYSYFSGSTYKKEADWEGSNLQMELDNYPAGTYTTAPLFKIFNSTVEASPNSSVTVTGSSSQPTIIADPTSLAFGAVALGNSVSKTFVVTGTDLTGDLSLKSTNHVFTVSPSTISKSSAVNGVTVTVTYTPDSVVNNGGYINITGGGAERVRVSLSGKGVQPSITITPTSWDFGTVGVDQTSIKKFTVKGTNISGQIAIVSQYEEEFTITPTDLPASGGTVTVTYKPTSGGNHSGWFKASSTNPTVSATASFTGKCTDITTSKSSLDFGTIAKGGSKELTFTVTGVNLSGNLTLTRTGSSYFSVTPESITKTSSNAASGTVTVTYNPKAAGSHTGTITITDGTVSKTVNLTGKGAGITISPSTYDFGTCIIGQTYTKAFTVTGTNISGQISIVSQYEEEFTVTPTVLPASGGTVTVTYKPMSGSNFSGWFKASSTNPTMSATASFTGKCTDITTSKSSLDFGTIAKGGSKELTFTVTGVNLSGNLTLTCTGSSYFSVSPASITKNSSNGASGTVTVTYNPKAAGNHTGTITITDGTVSKTVNLNGKSAGITISPSTYDFGTSTKGQTSTKKFTVKGTNISGQIAIVSQYEEEFTITPTDLPASGGTVTVTYKPTSGGNHSGWFKASSTNPTVSATASFTGKCTDITTSKSSLDFGTIAKGGSKDLTFTVTGVNLSGNLTLTRTGSSYFSVTPVSITKTSSNGASGTITVTYNPKAAGNHTGTITITDGTVSRTVSLTGKSADITISPSTYDFGTCTKGQTYTKTFIVTGTNISGQISIVTQYEEEFTVTPSVLPASGGTVTVTYKPTSAGSFSGWFKASSTNPSVSAIANFTGKCVVPVPSITVNPDSVWCGNTPYGSYNTKTFTVTGSNLTGNLNLISSNTTIFSVTPTTITPSNGAVNQQVTVTYRPSTVHVGNKKDNGTIRVIGGGATTKIVAVSGRGIDAMP